MSETKTESKDVKRSRTYISNSDYDEMIKTEVGKQIIKGNNIHPDRDKFTRGNLTEIQKSINNSVHKIVSGSPNTTTIDKSTYLLNSEGEVVQFCGYYRKFSNTFSDIEKSRYEEAKTLLTNGKNVGKPKKVQSRK